MKRFLSHIPPLAAALALMALVCCHGHHGGWCASWENRQFHILASSFPIYIFTANICANAQNVKLETLIPAAAGCAHDFAPSPTDLRKLAKADALVINGHGLEDFPLRSRLDVAPKLPVVDAGLNVPALAGQYGQTNPHIFAAPEEAALMVKNIAAGLAALDPANAATYAANGQAYAGKLAKLSSRFKAIGAKAGRRGIAIEHGALAYLAHNAGLDVVAILEEQDSAARVARMRQKLKASRPELVAADAQYPERLLKTLASDTGLPFDTLDPCASGPANAPLDYYETVMEKNAAILEAYFD